MNIESKAPKIESVIDLIRGHNAWKPVSKYRCDWLVRRAHGGHFEFHVCYKPAKCSLLDGFHPRCKAHFPKGA